MSTSKVLLQAEISSHLRLLWLSCWINEPKISRQNENCLLWKRVSLSFSIKLCIHSSATWLRLVQVNVMSNALQIKRVLNIYDFVIEIWSRCGWKERRLHRQRGANRSFTCHFTVWMKIIINFHCQTSVKSVSLEPQPLNIDFSRLIIAFGNLCRFSDLCDVIPHQSTDWLVCG